MTVDGLLKNGFGAVATPETDREITGVYIGDLLSWVMGRAQSGDAWITIMSNANIGVGHYGYPRVARLCPAHHPA